MLERMETAVSSSMFSVISFIMRVLEFSFLFLLLIFFSGPVGFTWFTPGGKAEFLELLSCTGNERNTRQKGWLGLHTFAYNLAPVQGETGRAGDFPKAAGWRAAHRVWIASLVLLVAGSVGGYECAVGLDQGWEASCVQLCYNPFPLCVAK